MDNKTKRLFSISCMAIVALSILVMAVPAMADDRCPTPDLTILEKSEVLDGDALSVTYTIKNIGDGDAGASTTCVYANGVEIATDSVGTLKSGESYTNTVAIDQFDCPCGTTVTIKVCADNDDDVKESNERNNCLENNLKCLPCPCKKPDLTILEKSEVLDGDALSVTYTIKNIGDGDAGASTTCVYANGVEIATDSVGTLKSGESYTNTVTIDQFDCPCGTTVTIKVCADNDDDVKESNERNNCLENNLKCLPCPCKKPDLTILEKSEVLDGDALSVTYTIKNIGDGDAGASTTCVYANGVEIATDSVGTLKSGESYTNTVTIDQFDCPCGTTVTIKVCADNDDDVKESNERNNCLENNLKCLPCPCKKPDLTILEKSEVLDGDALSVTYTIKNIGDGDAGASTTCVYANGVEIATDSVGTLKSGESYTNTVTIDQFDCPCGTTVTIKVCADNDDDVKESNERNNCLENNLKCLPCPCKKPDLTILEKSEVLDGDALSVTYTIKNIGDGDAGASTTCVYANGVEIATDSVGTLKSGESYTNTVTIDQFDCPCGTTVTIKVCADNDDDVKESNERNNCLENNLKCLPCPCKKPDLTILEKSEVLDGDALSVTYTIKNIGDGDAGASTTCVYANGVEIATDSVGTLKSGESYTNTVTIDQFDCPCGTTVTIKVCADNDDDVKESNERNNCLENNLKCLPCEKPDLEIVQKSETWVSLDDTTYTITYTVKNNGDGGAAASTTAIMVNGVEVTTDPVPELASGESCSNTLGPFTMQRYCDTIEVCADSDDAVAESNEGNNCKRNTFCRPGPLTSAEVPVLTPFGAAILIGSLSIFAALTMRRRDE